MDLSNQAMMEQIARRQIAERIREAEARRTVRAIGRGASTGHTTPRSGRPWRFWVPRPVSELSPAPRV